MKHRKIFHVIVLSIPAINNHMLLLLVFMISQQSVTAIAGAEEATMNCSKCDNTSIDAKHDDTWSKYLRPSIDVEMPSLVTAKTACFYGSGGKQDKVEWEEILRILLSSQSGILSELSRKMSIVEALFCITAYMYQDPRGISDEYLAYRIQYKEMLESIFDEYQSDARSNKAALLLALVAYTTGDGNSAMKWFERYLSKATEREHAGEAHLGMGMIYFSSGEYQKAHQAFKESSKGREFAVTCQATYMLGWTELRLGNVDNAKTLFQELGRAWQWKADSAGYRGIQYPTERLCSRVNIAAKNDGSNVARYCCGQ